jgi:photosystem II stability/assembly factor-like uncharacterized protein
MVDEHLRRRLRDAAAHGERAATPPEPDRLYQRARRRSTRLAAVAAGMVLALLVGAVVVRANLVDDAPAAPPTLPVPTTRLTPTTSPPTTGPAPTSTTAASGQPGPPAALPPPPMLGDDRGDVLGAQLVTPSAGWALTRQRLAWTDDIGRSWRAIGPVAVRAARIRGVFFLDPRTGWLVASGNDRETGSRVQLAAYATTDAGATWRRTPLAELDLGGDNAAGGFETGFGLLAHLHFVDRRHGWSFLRTLSPNQRTHEFLFRTVDGGATWTRMRNPPLGSSPSAPVRFISRTIGFAVDRSLYATDDGGRTWTRRELVPPAALRGTAIVVTDAPTFSTRRDGVLPVQFRRDEAGMIRTLAVGFYVTANGGASWEPRYVPLAEQDEDDPTTLAGRGQVLVAVVGHEGQQVLVSTDSGRAWSAAPTGLEGRYPVLRGLSFATAQAGWAVTGVGTSLEPGCNPSTPACDQRGVLIVTRDGGRSWARAAPG